MVYEFVLLAALMFAATALFLAFAGDARGQPARTVLQVFLLLVAGCYFVWNWTGGRRTLPMRTWRLRVVDANGDAPQLRAAISRYVYAMVGLAACGLGLIWALVDRDRQFLHDRMAGTRLITEPR
jgi:uncharacterized RDD family membrane protein YckC